MTLYLDVGMVRVQRYLGRWPSLRGRRGASSMAAAAFVWPNVESKVRGRARLNEEAAVVDGKISLVIDAGSTDAVEKVALDVLALARGALPAGEFEATWAEGSNYIGAHREIDRKRAAGEALVSLPPVGGLPAFKICDLCAQSPASKAVTNPEKSDHDAEPTVDACLDCAMRVDHQDSRPQHGKAAAFRLAEHLDRKLPKDFEALAKLGTDDKSNHLACIFADGNAFGAFFDGLLTSSRRTQVASFAKLFGEHTDAALRKAADAIQLHPKAASTLVHVQGGDDVLVSVPAAAAWTFTTVFLETFTSLVEETVKTKAKKLRPPTASAAIVFAHTSWPFDSASELAGELLSTAKGKFNGEEASIAWIDVTRRGALPSDAVDPLSLAQLDALRPAIGRVAAWDPSTRGRIAHLLHHEPEPVAMAKIGRTLQRHGLLGDVSPAALDDARQLERLIDIAHWWEAT